MSRLSNSPDTSSSLILARNVRQQREALGLSQDKLARAARIDAASLSRIETGRGGERGIGLARIDRLAKALGVPPSRLLEP